MANDRIDETLYSKAESKIKSLFNIENLNKFQEEGIKNLLLRKDVLIILPTGSGKSLIFQSFPVVFDVTHSVHSSIFLVISPLPSLMQDQVNYLESVGIRAAFIGDDQTDEEVKKRVEDGFYQLVYGSPEAFLATSRWRKLLTNDVYRKRVCLIAVDEAHCIQHWGYALKKGEQAFRKWFSRINEIRSLLKQVPILALTATATMSTRNKIVRALEMDTAVVINHSPNRKNIAYAVQAVSGGASQTFGAVVQALKEKKICFERMIIYCQTIKIVSHIYGVFKVGLGDDMYLSEGDRRSGMVEMYHSRIDELNRENIMKDFSKPNGNIRILIATIPYGMGINCQGVKSIVHYGPSRNAEAYRQESGRAGRDSSDLCKATMLYSNVMLKHCDEAIREYAQNSTIRRLSHFHSELGNLDKPSKPHECCDICQRQCRCEGDVCKFCYFESMNLNVPPCVSTNSRHVTSVQKKKLEDKLQYIQETVLKDVMYHIADKNAALFTSFDLVSGFGRIQIRQVLDNCDKLFTTSDIHKFVDIWDPQVATEILVAVTQVFGDTCYEESMDSDDEDDLLCFWSWGSDQDNELLANIPLEFIELAESIHVEEFEYEM